MNTDFAALEQRRIQSLLDVDETMFEELHDDGYLLCNPTGAVWGKAEYLERLTSGGLVYRRLAALTDIDVLAGPNLAVLRYRCAIELQIDGADVPAHECWHLDVYTLGSGDRWRCKWSQATGIMVTPP